MDRAAQAAAELKAAEDAMLAARERLCRAAESAKRARMDRCVNEASLSTHLHRAPDAP